MDEDAHPLGHTRRRPVPVVRVDRPMATSRTVLWVLLLFLGTRLLLTAVGVLARAEVVPPPETATFVLYPTGHASVDVWAAYDSRWYAGIAEEGYRTFPRWDTDRSHTFAFAPLYPALMRALQPLTHGVYSAGLLVSNAALLASAFLLHRTVERRWGPRTAWVAVLLLLCSPTSFYLSAALSESLFLVLVLGSVAAADRERWWLAGILAGLAALTRVVGLVLILPLGIEYLRRHRRPGAGLWTLLLVPLLFLPFLFSAQQVTGDFLAPFHAHTLSPWNRHLDNPLAQILQGLATTDGVLRVWATIAILVPILLVASARTLGPMLTILGFALFLTPLSTGLLSMLRQTAVQFPLVMSGARALRGPVLVAVLVASLVLQCILMALWTTAHPVTI